MKSVVLHAYRVKDNGDRVRCAMDGPKDGYSVYIKTEVPDQPAEIHRVGTWPIKQSAIKAASWCAVKADLGPDGWVEG